MATAVPATEEAAGTRLLSYPGGHRAASNRARRRAPGLVQGSAHTCCVLKGWGCRGRTGPVARQPPGKPGPGLGVVQSGWSSLRASVTPPQGSAGTAQYLPWQSREGTLAQTCSVLGRPAQPRQKLLGPCPRTLGWVCRIDAGCPARGEPLPLSLHSEQWRGEVTGQQAGRAGAEGPSVPQAAPRQPVHAHPAWFGSQGQRAPGLAASRACGCRPGAPLGHFQETWHRGGSWRRKSPGASY